MTRVTTLADLIPATVERAPTTIASVDVSTTYTWQDMSDRVGSMRRHLATNGTKRGDRVGVHFRKSADGFTAMHAVVSLGAIAVPLDPGASATYLASIAAMTGLQSVLTHHPCAATANALGETGLTVLDVEAMPAETVNADDDSPHATVHPDDPAYIITTSGSTGRPKGICHTHRSALAYVDFKRSAYDLGPEDRIGDIAPNHFDISTLAVWVTPAVGAANVVVPEAHQVLPASLSQLMADSRMSVWYGVPYLLTQLDSRGAIDERDLSGLRLILFGGEVMTPGTIASLMDKLPHAQFSNVYGPAEVNACAIHHLTEPPAAEGPIPIGRPVPPTEVRVIEPKPEKHTVTAEPTRLSPGEQGELVVRAETMMHGYWQREDLTEPSMLDWEGARWYRTGDLGYERTDGSLVFAGRVDHQVKVRGHRVELEAIEAVLEDGSGVLAAVATVARSPDGSDIVIVGLQPEPGVDVDHDELRRLADSHLPHYAVPAHFLPINSAPRTGSGKLDRRAIRAELLRETTRASQTHQEEGIADV